MPTTSPDVFLEPEDEISGGTTDNGFGVVRIRSASSVHIFSRDPDQLEALAEACMAAARDLRIDQAPPLSSLIEGDDTSAAMTAYQAEKAERLARNPDEKPADMLRVLAEMFEQDRDASAEVAS